MEFDKLYRRLIKELNQSTINSALLKHQSIKGKNPIAKSRAEDFSKRARSQGEKRGILIRTKLSAETRRTADYANYYIEGAIDYNKDYLRFKALMVDPFEDNESKPAELTYDTNSDTLSVISPGHGTPYGQQLWLQSRTDAMNLSKTIKKYTGMNVSWKNMDFVDSGDYSNQYADTRYDMSKLGK